MKIFRNKKIIITGGRGYIGSKLSEYFSNIDCDLILVDRSNKSIWMPKGKIAKIKHVKLNLSNSNDVLNSKLFLNSSFIFHFAGAEIDYDKNIFDDYSDNTLILLNILNYCKKFNIKAKIVNASAAMIYGLTKKLPVNENASNNPPSFWATHKLFSEQYLEYFSRNHNIKSLSLRLSNVYGPINRINVLNKMVLNKIIYLALKNKKIYVFNNSHCIRDFVYIDDVIQAFLLACNIPDKYFDGRHFLIGSGEGKKIIDIWKKVAFLIGNVKIEKNNNFNLHLAEKRNFISDSRKFKKITLWKPKIRLTEGLKKTLEFIEKNFNKL